MRRVYQKNPSSLSICIAGWISRPVIQHGLILAPSMSQVTGGSLERERSHPALQPCVTLIGDGNEGLCSSLLPGRNPACLLAIAHACLLPGSLASLLWEANYRSDLRQRAWVGVKVPVKFCKKKSGIVHEVQVSGRLQRWSVILSSQGDPSSSLPSSSIFCKQALSSTSGHSFKFIAAVA